MLQLVLHERTIDEYSISTNVFSSLTPLSEHSRPQRWAWRRTAVRYYQLPLKSCHSEKPTTCSVGRTQSACSSDITRLTIAKLITFPDPLPPAATPFAQLDGSWTRWFFSLNSCDATTRWWAPEVLRSGGDRCLICLYYHTCWSLLVISLYQFVVFVPGGSCWLWSLLSACSRWPNGVDPFLLGDGNSLHLQSQTIQKWSASWEPRYQEN